MSDDGNVFFSWYGNNNIRIFNYSNGIWNEENHNLPANLAGHHFDTSFDGKIIVYTTRTANSTNNNYTYTNKVFQKNSSNNWVQMGDNLDTQTSGTHTGLFPSLSQNGLTLGVIERATDNTVSQNDYIKIYKYNGSNWDISFREKISIDTSIYLSGQLRYEARDIELSNDGNYATVILKDTAVPSDYDDYLITFKYENNQWSQYGSVININEIGNFGEDAFMEENGTIIHTTKPRNLNSFNKLIVRKIY